VRPTPAATSPDSEPVNPPRADAAWLDVPLTVDEAAAFLKVSRKTMERLPVRYAKVGTLRRYLRRWLVEWLTARAA
jgi:hypothetical protein